METRKKLNAPRGQIPTRLQASQALILSAPVLDRLEARQQEPRGGPAEEGRLVPWRGGGRWGGGGCVEWGGRWGRGKSRVAEQVMLPAKPRIRLSRNSTGRAST